jgi:hypothetical protein
MIMEFNLNELLERLDPDVLKADGFDDAVIGVAYRCGSGDVLAYDFEKIILKLMLDGMSREEAEEYFEFNILGAYVGEYTPVFISR